MKSFAPAAALAAALLVSATASATTVGLPDSSTSSIWDTFSGTSFTSAAATTPAGPFTTAALTFTSGADALLLGSGDRIYAGGDSVNFDISATPTADLTSITLTLKFTAAAFTTSDALYTMDLNGVTAAATLVGSSVEGANTFGIYQWTWTGLDLTAGTNFHVTGSATADHESLDAISLGGSVPEASTGILGLVAAGALLARRRR